MYAVRLFSYGQLLVLLRSLACFAIYCQHVFAKMSHGRRHSCNIFRIVLRIVYDVVVLQRLESSRRVSFRTMCDASGIHPCSAFSCVGSCPPCTNGTQGLRPPSSHRVPGAIVHVLELLHHTSEAFLSPFCSRRKFSPPSTISLALRHSPSLPLYRGDATHGGSQIGHLTPVLLYPLVHMLPALQAVCTALVTVFASVALIYTRKSFTVTR